MIKILKSMALLVLMIFIVACTGGGGNNNQSPNNQVPDQGGVNLQAPVAQPENIPPPTQQYKFQGVVQKGPCAAGSNILICGKKIQDGKLAQVGECVEAKTLDPPIITP